MGLRTALRLRGRQGAGEIRRAPRRASTEAALAPLVGAGPWLCTVRCRTRDVDAGSHDRPPGRPCGPGDELRQAGGRSAARASALVPPRPAVSPAAVPLGAHARPPGAPERSG